MARREWRGENRVQSIVPPMRVLPGVVTVPLNPKLGARESVHVLDDAEPVLLLAAEPDEIAAEYCGGRQVQRLVQEHGQLKVEQTGH